MTLNDTLQLAAVIVILTLCAIWLIRRFRRRKGCSSCSSTTCPLRGKEHKPTQKQ